MYSNNTKKKFALGVVLVSAITMAGLQSAVADPWRVNPGIWRNRGCGETGGFGYQGQQQLDEKSIAARETFLSETTELRREIAMKKAEKFALMVSDNPDVKEIAQLTGELFDLREQLQKKAREKGFGKEGFGLSWNRGNGGLGPGGFRGRL